MSRLFGVRFSRRHTLVITSRAAFHTYKTEMLTTFTRTNVSYTGPRVFPTRPHLDTACRTVYTVHSTLDLSNSAAVTITIKTNAVGSLYGHTDRRLSHPCVYITATTSISNCTTFNTPVAGSNFGGA